jgi:hypothetical protein
MTMRKWQFPVTPITVESRYWTRTYTIDTAASLLYLYPESCTFGYPIHTYENISTSKVFTVDDVFICAVKKS